MRCVFSIRVGASRGGDGRGGGVERCWRWPAPNSRSQWAGHQRIMWPSSRLSELVMRGPSMFPTPWIWTELHPGREGYAQGHRPKKIYSRR